MKQLHSTYHQKLLCGFHLCVTFSELVFNEPRSEAPSELCIFQDNTSIFFLSLGCWVVSMFFCTGSQPTLESSIQLSTSTLSSWLAPQHGFCRRCRDGKETATTQESGEDRPEIGRVSGATGTAVPWKGSRKRNCRRSPAQRWRSYSSAGAGKDTVPWRPRQRSRGGQEGMQRGGSHSIISGKIRNPCLLERMISSPNLVTGGRVITARSSGDLDPETRTSPSPAQT